MKDDDGTLYYEGIYLNAKDPGLGDSFQPLDCFGQPNAGCTTIEYKDNGKWTTL